MSIESIKAVAIAFLLLLNGCYSCGPEEMSVVSQNLDLDLKTLADARVF